MRWKCGVPEQRRSSPQRARGPEMGKLTGWERPRKPFERSRDSRSGSSAEVPQPRANDAPLGKSVFPRGDLSTPSSAQDYLDLELGPRSHAHTHRAGTWGANGKTGSAWRRRRRAAMRHAPPRRASSCAPPGARRDRPASVRRRPGSRLRACCRADGRSRPAGAGPPPNAPRGRGAGQRAENRGRRPRPARN